MNIYISKMAIISFLFITVSCATIMKGPYSKVNVVMPQNTHVFDSSNYELPIHQDVPDKTRYILLRSSQQHILLFVKDSLSYRTTVNSKFNYYWAIPNIFSPFLLGNAVDYLNGSGYELEDIDINEADFESIKVTKSDLIFYSDSLHSIKRQVAKKITKQSGLFSREHDFSLYIGIGLHSLGMTFFVPPYSSIGAKYKINNDFDVKMSINYHYYWLGHTTYYEYDNPVYRFTGYGTELIYHPFINNGFYFSLGIGITDYRITADSRDEYDKEIFFAEIHPITSGIGYSGKWYSVDANYSFAFPKIAPKHRKPYNLNYFTLGIYFNLPI